MAAIAKLTHFPFHFIRRGVVKSSSGESLPAGAVPSSHPYKIPQPPPTIAKYDPDFPLRKTGTHVGTMNGIFVHA